jgi:hypothetical protein
MATTVAQVRRALRDQLLTLSGWRETSFPLGILETPSTQGHLSFSVVDESAQNISHRGKSGDTVAHEISFRVSFLYRMTPSAADLMSDWDDSSDAAQDAIQALMDQGSWQYNYLIRYTRMNRSRLSDSAWLQIDLFFTVEHELEV